MKPIKSVLVCASIVLGAGAAAFACSSEVTDTGLTGTSSGTTSSSSTSGSGGAGGAVTTGPASASSTAASTSASTGGGNLCDQACAKFSGECMIGDICSLAMIDCSMPGTECFSQCILDASCADLVELVQTMVPPPALGACLQGCQGGQGGGGQGGGNPQGCGQCALGSCQGEIQACNNDMDCQPWLQCVQGCMGPDPDCVAGCDAMNPNADTTAVYACLCASCANECAVADPCNKGGAGGAGGAMP